MVWQLRGHCGKRQVQGAKVALSHNLGLGGACVVTIYKRPDAWQNHAPKQQITRATSIEGERIKTTARL